jgi:hypothetical protein
MPRKDDKTSRTTARTMERVMHEFKEGELKSGASGRPVKSRRQAVAIGLSEARAKGAKLPAPRTKRGRKA